MGLLDQVIGGVLGQVLGGGQGHRHGEGAPAPGGGMGGAMSPIVQALLMLLLQKGMSGGLGDILGGGRQAPPRQPYEADPHDGGGDLGGFGQDGGQGRYDDRRGGDGGEFGDLAGMLDGPGAAQAGSSRPMPGSFDDGPTETRGGFDGLVDRFRREGLGDVMESWIGPGPNRPVEPSRLGDALGPRTVDALSSRTGLDPQTLLSQLAQVLPGVVDGLTPKGRAPTPDDRHGW